MSQVSRGLRALAGLARSVHADRAAPPGASVASSGLSGLVSGAACAAGAQSAPTGASGAARALANPRWKSSVANDGTTSGDDATAPRVRKADVDAARELLISMAREKLGRDIKRLSKTSVNALKVGQLREALASMGEGTQGPKADLVSRVMRAVGPTASPTAEPAAPPAPATPPPMDLAADALGGKDEGMQRRARKALGRRAMQFLLERFEEQGIKGNKRNPKDKITANMVEKVKVKSLRAGLAELGVTPEGVKKDVVRQWLGLIYNEPEAQTEVELPPVPVFQRPPPPPPPPATVPMPDVVDLLVRCRTRDVVVVDVSQKCDFTDALVIASAGSRSLAQSAAHAVGNRLREGGALSSRGHKPGIEGEGTDWMCVNGGQFLVHIMTEEAREYYDLEGLWGGEGGKDILRPVQEPKRLHSLAMS